MRIDALRLTNFRCFDAREWELAARFNLLVGDNATGKTTILDGLAIGLGALLFDLPAPAKSRTVRTAEIHLRRFRHGETWTEEPQYPVRIACRGEVDGHQIKWARGLSNPRSRTSMNDAESLREISRSLYERTASGGQVVLPVLSYYGTGRLWSQVSPRNVASLGVGSRFVGYLDCLNPLSDEKRLLSWFKTQELAGIQSGRAIPALEACRRVILNCVAEARRVRFDVARDALMLTFDTGDVDFDQLSDGYRNMLAMVADIAVRCATLNPDLGADAPRLTPGVVLIDEIDLHLHPKWQRRVVGDLMNAFPRIQFVGTTHSPFVIQSLPPIPGVRLVNLDDPKDVDFANKSVEDVAEYLQHVELPQRSRRYLEMEDAAKRYYDVLERASGANDADMLMLRQKLDELARPFSDDPAYQAFLSMKRASAKIDQEPS